MALVSLVNVGLCVPRLVLDTLSNQISILCIIKLSKGVLLGIKRHQMGEHEVGRDKCLGFISNFKLFFYWRLTNR